MTDPSIETYLPTFHQKAAAGALAIVGVTLIIRLMRAHRLREEHALLWLVSLAALVTTLYSNRLLILISSAFGIKVPASAIILLSVFLLFTICVWLTSIVSVQKRQISKMIIMVSILRSRVELLEQEKHGS